MAGSPSASPLTGTRAGSGRRRRRSATCGRPEGGVGGERRLAARAIAGLHAAASRRPVDDDLAPGRRAGRELALQHAEGLLRLRSSRASVLTPETPVFMPSSGTRRGAGRRRRAPGRAPGGAWRAATRASQKTRPAARASSSRRPRYGTRRLSTRSPSSPQHAPAAASARRGPTCARRGSRRRRGWKMVVGTISMPISASTTVMPLKNTARLAVPPVTRDRVELVAAAARAPRGSARR